VKIIRCATSIASPVILRMPGVTSATVADELTTIMTSQPEAALRELLALDPLLHSLDVQSPRLEDAFLALTGENE